jgi:hypothetical protein
MPDDDLDEGPGLVPALWWAVPLSLVLWALAIGAGCRWLP